MSRKTVELIEKRIAYQGYYRVEEYRLRHEQYAGGIGPEIKREVFERGDAVAVLPYDPGRDEVVLIEQFRVGPYLRGDNPWMLEIVAGVIDDGETQEQVVRREAMEEAGLTLRRIERIMGAYASPGALTEHVTIYCGQVDAGSAGGIHGLDHEGEDIQVVVLPFTDALARMAAGDVTASPGIIALQWLALNREDLRQRWRF